MKYHPRELAIVGPTSSGKTALIRALVQELSLEFDVGYIKHEIAEFEIDHHGKDSYLVTGAGARSAFITSRKKNAFVTGEKMLAQENLLFIAHDFVLIEGFRDSKIPKILVLNHGGDINRSGHASGNKNENTEFMSKVDLSTVAAIVVPDEVVISQFRPPVAVPVFHYEDILQIVGFIKEWLNKKVPLYGLVLAGGHSVRMGQDKAQMVWHQNKSQVEYCYELLSAVCEKTFVSARKEQKFALPTIYDRLVGFGPMGGILTAQYDYPGCAFLVLAVDLPLVTTKTLKDLIAFRAPLKFATTWLTEGVPEPLCTIYEPKSKAGILMMLAADVENPRDFLLTSNVKSVEIPQLQSLLNINIPSDVDLVQNLISASFLR